MKTYTAITYSLALGLVVYAVASCSLLSEETTQSGAAVAALWQEINADGIVTDEESERYVTALNEWYGLAQGDLSDTDWNETLAEVLGAASVAFFGVNFFRNKVQGKGGLVIPKAASTLPSA